MRRLALLGVLAGASLLSACGFTPMYGETGVSGGADDRKGALARGHQCWIGVWRQA